MCFLAHYILCVCVCVNLRFCCRVFVTDYIDMQKDGDDFMRLVYLHACTDIVGEYEESCLSLLSKRLAP